MFNREFLEEYELVQAFAPVDLATAGATGDWIDMRPFERIVVVLVTAVGTAAQDAVLSLDQAKTAAGGSNKALNFTKLYHKTGDTALSGVGQWSKVTQTASDSYDTDPIDGAENEQIIAIEIKAEDLDTDNDFRYIQLAVADDVAAAQLAFGLYIGKKRYYARAVEDNASAID